MPIAAYFSISATGTGAAPLRIHRSLDRSTVWCSGTWSMKFSIAGTASMMSMRSLSTSRQTALGSNARSTTVVMPRWMLVVSGVSAPTWKSGSESR
jgi:hypothetical protein